MSCPDQLVPDTHKKDASVPPPVLNSGLNPSAGVLPPPTVIHTKEDKDTDNAMQDGVTENREESEGVLGTRSGNEEPENRTFDQVLASLAELTEKYCENAQVSARTIIIFSRCYMYAHPEP